jgi:hypothetical protein
MNAPAVAGVSSASQNASGSSSNKSSSAQYGPQYLEKSLQVTIEVKNTLQAASSFQQWLAQTDTQATSDGANYQLSGANQYIVTLTFLIDVSHYNQVEDYLRNSAGQLGGTLLSLEETVQDETSSYVDAQSTLTNLRAEQQRLLTFMNETQNVNDAVNIEQQLSQVEGQIDTIEAQLNDLKGQTSFYSVTVTLQPLGSVPPPPTSSPWSIIPIWQGAWSGVVTVGEGLASVLAWLLAFSVYIIPLCLLVWLLRKRPWRRPQPLFVSPMASAPVPTDEASRQPVDIQI